MSRNTVEIILSVVDKRFSKNLDKAKNKFNQVDRSGKRATKSLTSGFNKLNFAIGSLVSTLTASALINLADQYSNINARLRLVTDSSEELLEVQKELYRISQQTGTSYLSNASAFAKLALGLEALNVPTKELLAINALVNKSLVVSGASAEETSSFILQFTQAMGSGVLQGDEFRAMMESNSFFGSKLAKALKTDIDGLRAMSKAGQLTTDVLRKAFPEMAEEINAAFDEMPLTVGRALTQIKNAFGKILSESNEAAKGTQSLAESFNALVKVIEDNGEAIQEMIIGVINMAKVVASLVIENRENIITIAKWTAGLYLARKALFPLVEGVRLLSTVVKSTIVLNIFKWLTGIGVASASARTGAILLANSLRAGLVGAVIVAIVKITELILLMREHKRIQQSLAEQEEHLVSVREKLAGKIAKISRQTGVAMKSQKDFNEAVKSGAIVFDKATGKWINGYEKVGAEATKTAEIQKKVTGDALKEMQKAYEAYADKVKSLNDEIRNRQQSLSEQIRALTRSGLSDLGQWEDRKKEADEYFESAKAAAAAGNFEEAEKFADKAKSAYEDLNKEVKEGDKVLISQAEALETAIDGVKKSGELAIEILKEQETVAADAMDALIADSGFADLAKNMDESKKKWLLNWREMRLGADSELDKLEDKILKIVSDKTMTVFVNVKERGGGSSGNNFADGGRARGPAGIDKIRANLTRDEVVIKNRSVKAAGMNTALAFNEGKFGYVVSELTRRFGFAEGGIARETNQLPSVNISGGGGGGFGGLIPIDLRVTNEDPPLRLFGLKDQVVAAKRMEKRMARRSS